MIAYGSTVAALTALTLVLSLPSVGFLFPVLCFLHPHQLGKVMFLLSISSSFEAIAVQIYLQNCGSAVNTIADDTDSLMCFAGAMAQTSPAVGVNELPSTPVSPAPGTTPPGVADA